VSYYFLSALWLRDEYAGVLKFIDREERVSVGFFSSKSAVEPIAHGIEQANTQEGYDAPRKVQHEDGLERWSVAESIYRTIKATPPGYSTRIGLYGEWGAGKSTVLNFLDGIAQAGDDVVIRVSAWRTVDANSFVTSLSEAMTTKIKSLNASLPWRLKLKSRGGRAFSFVEYLSQMTGQSLGKIDNDMGTMVSMGAALTGSIANTVQQRLHLSSSDMEQLRALLIEHRVIVIIDDLDRADPVILPKSLMALREYLDMPGFAFVLAFDKAIIEQSLKAYSHAFSSSRHAFLDKIIDFEFELVPPPQSICSRYAGSVLELHCEFIPKADRDSSAQWFPDNPRLTRTVARELGSLKEIALRHGNEELKWEAIILQTLLRREAAQCAQIVEKQLLGRGKPMLAILIDQARKNDAVALLVSALDASGIKRDSEAFNRLYGLVVKLQGLRMAQEPDQIALEMLLPTQQPSFTQKEFLSLLVHWDEYSDEAFLLKRLKAAAQIACTDEYQVSATLVNMTLNRYSFCIERMSDQKEEAQRGKWLQQTEQTARLLWGLVQSSHISYMEQASGEIDFCMRMMELFSSYARREFQPDELWLRCIEAWIMGVVAERCKDQVALFYRCKQYLDKALTLADVPLLQNVYTLTQRAAVADAVGLFTTANAISLCNLDPKQLPRLELLRDVQSVLYSRSYKEKLLTVLTPNVQLEQRYVVAKNALDYLAMQLARNNDIKVFFDTHPDLLKACWRAAVVVSWRQDMIDHLLVLRKRLQDWKVDVAGLADPGSATV